TFGLAHAYGPLVPFSRTPLVVLVGEVQDKPVVEGGRVVVHPVMTLGVTFDHRFMDGFQGGAMAQLFRTFLEDPAHFDRLVPEAAMRPNEMPSPRSLAAGPRRLRRVCTSSTRTRNPCKGRDLRPTARQRRPDNTVPRRVGP